MSNSGRLIKKWRFALRYSHDRNNFKGEVQHGFEIRYKGGKDSEIVPLPSPLYTVDTPRTQLRCLPEAVEEEAEVVVPLLVEVVVAEAPLRWARPWLARISKLSAFDDQTLVVADARFRFLSIHL